MRNVIDHLQAKSSVDVRLQRDALLFPVPHKVEHHDPRRLYETVELQGVQIAFAIGWYAIDSHDGISQFQATLGCGAVVLDLVNAHGLSKGFHLEAKTWLLGLPWRDETCMRVV